MLCAMIIANTQILNPVRLMKNINFYTDLDEIYLLVFTTKKVNIPNIFHANLFLFSLQRLSICKYSTSARLSFSSNSTRSNALMVMFDPCGYW